MTDPVSKLSIVVPVYNERETLVPIVERVLAVALPCDPQSGVPISREIIIVDDGSTDGSDEIARNLAAKHPDIRVVSDPVNHGKGYALRVGLARATGEIIIVQDADLEYDPADYPALLAPILAGNADVVYGSRLLGKGRRGAWMFYLGGRLVTIATNLLYRSQLTDEPTCYKMFRRSVLDRIHLTCTGFEFCPEFTAKALRAGYRIHEVPIKYDPRTAAEGKKISWKDGVEAIWTLLKYRCFR